MFLALLELRAARGRFLLMGSVVVLVAALVGIVSGFTTGLGDDTISALRRLPASHLVFSSDARSDQFARSLLDAKTASAWREDADTDTTPLGISITRGTTDRGTEVDLAAFGIDPAAFLNPSVTSGKGLTTDAADTVVISAKLADEGVRIGDTLVIDRLGIRLRVVGLTERSSYGHVPAAYVPLATWQRIRFSTPGAPASAAAAELPDQFSALALRTPAGTPVADLDKRHSTSTVTKEKAYEAAPGYTGERLTMNSIQVFLYLIAPWWSAPSSPSGPCSGSPNWPCCARSAPPAGGCSSTPCSVPPSSSSSARPRAPCSPERSDCWSVNRCRSACPPSPSPPPCAPSQPSVCWAAP